MAYPYGYYSMNQPIPADSTAAYNPGWWTDIGYADEGGALEDGYSPPPASEPFTREMANERMANSWDSQNGNTGEGLNIWGSGITPGNSWWEDAWHTGMRNDDMWAPGIGTAQNIIGAIDSPTLDRYLPGQGDPDPRAVYEDVRNDIETGNDPIGHALHPGESPGDYWDEAMPTAEGGAGGSGGDTETTRSVSQPWEPTQPYILGGDGRQGILPEAEALYRSGGPQYYGGDTVADLNSAQTGAMNRYANQGNRNYDPSQQGINQLQATSQGDYLGGGQFMSAYGDDILNNVNSQFGMAGRTASPAAYGESARQMGNVASRLYSDERSLQQQASLALPGMQNQLYGMQTGDTDAMMGAGYVAQGQQQSEMDAMKNRWDYNQNLPGQNLQQYQGFVNPIATGTPATVDTSSPLYQPNQYQGMLGGAMTGASAGSMFGPWGALIGGVAGGYLGSRS